MKKSKFLTFRNVLIISSLIGIVVLLFMNLHRFETIKEEYKNLEMGQTWCTRDDPFSCITILMVKDTHVLGINITTGGLESFPKVNFLFNRLKDDGVSDELTNALLYYQLDQIK